MSSGINLKIRQFGWVAYEGQVQELLGWEVVLERCRPSIAVFSTHQPLPPSVSKVFLYLGTEPEFKKARLMDGFKLRHKSISNKKYTEHGAIGFMRFWLKIPFNRQYEQATPTQVLADLAGIADFQFKDLRPAEQDRPKDLFFLGTVSDALEQIKRCWHWSNEKVDFAFTKQKILLYQNSLNTDAIIFEPQAVLQTSRDKLFVENLLNIRPAMKIEYMGEKSSIDRCTFRKSNLPLEIEYEPEN